MGSERWVYWMIPTHFRCYALYVSNSKQTKKKTLSNPKLMYIQLENFKNMAPFELFLMTYLLLGKTLKIYRPYAGFRGSACAVFRFGFFFSSGRRLFLIVACKFCKGLISITTKTRAKMEKNAVFYQIPKGRKKVFNTKKNIKIKLFKFLTISVH